MGVSLRMLSTLACAAAHVSHLRTRTPRPCAHRELGLAAHTLALLPRAPQLQAHALRTPTSAVFRCNCKQLELTRRGIRCSWCLTTRTSMPSLQPHRQAPSQRHPRIDPLLDKPSGSSPVVRSAADVAKPYLPFACLRAHCPARSMHPSARSVSNRVHLPTSRPKPAHSIFRPTLVHESLASPCLAAPT